MRFLPLVCVAAALLATNGGDLGARAAGGDTTVKLRSDAPTVKPWVTSAGETVPARSLAVTPATTNKAAKRAESAPTINVRSGTIGKYDPSALPNVGGEPPDSALWPAWRRSMARWEWKQIPGSDLSSVTPNPRVPGALSARIDAWNGLAADTRGNRLFSAANGGHADYAGNEVYEIDLTAESPRWVMLRAPTSADQVAASNGSLGVYNDYYLDGRPASTHTYYALQFLSSRNAIFKFGAGSLWGTGNEGNWKIDAFSLDDNDWLPAGSLPEVVPGSRRSVIAASICMNPVTEQVYIAAPGNIRRFEPDSGSVSILASWIQNASEVYGRACAVDPVRNRVVYFGDAYRTPVGGLVYDIASNSLTRISFVGDAGADIARRGSFYAWFEPKIGRFLLKTNIANSVYAIDPETLLVTPVATIGGQTLPNAMNGVQTRWQRLPALGGYAYYPKYGSGVWFLAIE